MPDLTPLERLQPCLLDRLTDNEPDKQQEGRDARVISLSRYREAVFRDVSWLLNAAAHSPGDEVYEFENVAHSVFNFGIPDVCGQYSHSTAEEDFESRFLAALRKFEPRIIENSLSVQATIDSEKMGATAVTFQIAGELWAQPANAMLYIKTALDLETGRSDLIGERR